MDNIINLSIMVLIFIAIAAVVIGVLLKCYKKVDNVNEVLVIKNYRGQFRIAEQGGFVFPLINSYYKVDYVPKRIAICYGDSAYIDNKSDLNTKYNAVLKSTNSGIRSYEKVRVDIRVEIKIKINSENEKDIIRAVQMHGDILESAEKLGHHLLSSFEDIIKAVTINMPFLELLNQRDKYRDLVKDGLMGSLDGLVISDVAIAYAEHTPIKDLDMNNMLDVEGSRWLGEHIAKKEIEAAQIEQERLTQINEKVVKGQQERMQLDKSLAQEKAKIDREIQNTQEEEKTKAFEKQQAETLKRQQVEIETNREIEIAEENRRRDVENATLSNQQAIGIKEQEARLEVAKKKIEADMITEKQTVETQSEIEKSKKGLIAQQAENTEMQDTLVKKQEEIKDTEAFKAADRNKKVKETNAAADAEAEKIRLITIAQADKEKSAIDADRKQIEAEANYKVVQKATDAGKLEVELEIQRVAAPAKAEAEAKIAEADGVRKLGEAQAEVIAKTGNAEAEAIESKGAAEAESLRVKYSAMSETGEESRQHEIAKIELENKLSVDLREIESRQIIGTEAERARAKAFESMDMRVYGDKAMLDTVLGATRDSEVRNTSLEIDKTKEWLKPYMSGEKSIPEELKEVLKSIGGEGGEGGELSKLIMLQKMLEIPALKQFFEQNQK